MKKFIIVAIIVAILYYLIGSDGLLGLLAWLIPTNTEGDGITPDWRNKNKL